MEIRLTDRVRRRKRPGPRGRVTLWSYCLDDQSLRHIATQPNQIQTSWGFAAAMALGMGDATYRIRAMYLEFANVGDPGDPVTVPAYDEDDGLEYFQDLALSSDADFLRVPLIQKPLLSIEEDYEDLFVEGESGNKLTFFTLSQGIAGVNGKPYSDSVNSKVYGACLVATPEFGDRTKDVIVARTYFDVADQTVKEASHQVGITWDLVFTRSEDA